MQTLGQGARSALDARADAELSISIPATPAAPPAVRRAMRALEDFVGPTRAGEVELLVTELVTNGVKHARVREGNRINLAARVEDDTLHVAVSDAGEGFAPPGRDESRSEPGGWGLMLVDGLADSWGIERGPTTVWFELGGGHSDRRLAA